LCCNVIPRSQPRLVLSEAKELFRCFIPPHDWESG
jgi:hypothetical protein